MMSSNATGKVFVVCTKRIDVVKVAMAEAKDDPLAKSKVIQVLGLTGNIHMQQNDTGFVPTTLTLGNEVDCEHCGRGGGY